MPNHAHVVLIGHLGKDPEIRTTPTGDEVAVFSLATTRKRAQEEITTWWRCTVWGKRAAVIGQYVAKGDALQIVGEPVLRPYTDRDGVPRVSLDVHVADFTILGGRKDAPVAHPGQSRRAPESRDGDALGSGARGPSGPSGAPTEDFDDDIPF